GAVVEMTETVNPDDGTRISFEEVGEGPAIVLAHGSVLSRVIWRGLGYTRALRERHRVIAVDLRGHGRSGKPHGADAYAMDLLVGDILAVLDSLDLPAAHYFGYSLGARVGFSLIDSMPSRVMSFISAGGTASPPRGGVDEVFFPGYDATLAESGMAGFVDRWGERLGAPVDAQTRLALLANDPEAMRGLFGALESEPGITDARLAELQTPTLLLAGTNDPERLLASRRAAELMPQATFVELAGRDHANTLRPSAPVLDLVLPFLAPLA
ncbi:MAG: hypothetical protein JWO10_780, partial [Microbacteriaceae bacterium]|nr:hypothetical protein [Microbacteriaceae bacterium]